MRACVFGAGRGNWSQISRAKLGVSLGLDGKG